MFSKPVFPKAVFLKTVFSKNVFASAQIALAALGFIALVSLQGCQSYRPSPVNLHDYSQQWAEPSLTDENLVEFASGLMEQESSAAVFNVEDGVSLQEAQLIGLLFNPQLSKERLESRLPLIGNKRSALFPDPEIELDFEPVTEGMDEKWLLNAQIGFVLPISFRIRTEMDKIASEYQAEMLGLLNSEQRTVRRIHDLWVQLYAIEKKQQVLNDHLSGLEDVIEQAGQSLSLSSMSASDLQSLALEAATGRSDLLALREQRIEYFIELASEMGLKADTPLQFQFAIPAVNRAVPQAQWQELLLANDAGLQVARADYQTAERNLELEIKKQYPDFIIGPIYQEGESRLGLNLTTLLPIWNRNLPAIEGARIERQVAGKELERVYQQKVNTLLGLEQRLMVLEQREHFFNDRLAPMIDQQFENIWQAIQLGTANILLLQDTLRLRLESKIDLLDIVGKSAVLKNQMTTILEPAHRVPVDLSPINENMNSKTNRSEGE